MSCRLQTSTCSTSSASKASVTMVSTPQPVFIRNLTPNVWSHLTFIYICVSRFLYEVQSFSSSNRMNIQMLATVFGPNILRAKAEDPQSTMGGKWKD